MSGPRCGQDLGFVDVRQILPGLDLPVQFLVSFDAEDAAKFYPVDQHSPHVLLQLLQQLVRVFFSALTKRPNPPNVFGFCPITVVSVRWNNR